MSSRLFAALKSLLPAVAGALLVLAMVAVNGRPSVFTDTDNYYGQGRNLVQGVAQMILPAATTGMDKPLDPKQVAHERLRMRYKHTSMAARSPFYGAFLYGMQQIGTLWLVSFLQAFSVSWLLLVLWRRIAPRAPAWTYYAMMAALAAITPLPFVASFAVPDIFAAAAILAVVLLVVFGEQLQKWERGLVWVMLLSSLIFHTSHLLNTAAMMLVSLALAWRLGADRRTLAGAGALITAALIVANLGMAIYGMGVKVKTGDEYRRPPFLAARVLADGPGRDYLRYSCTHGGTWALCRFKDRPLDDSDVILWSNKPTLGVFNRATPEERLLIEKQEPRFVLETIKYEPFGQVWASLKNWGLQIVTPYVDEAMKDPKIYLRHNYWGSSNLAPMLRELGPCTEKGGCTPRFDWEVLRVVHNGVTLIFLGLLIFRLTRDDVLRRFKAMRWDEPQSRVLLACGLLIAGVLINAAVCGVLSGVFARYQTRVVWLVPATAMLAAMGFAPQFAWARWRVLAEEKARAALGLLPPWIEPAFLRFGMVGACGFAVDAAVLHLLIDLAHFGYFGARLVSFPVAVCVTWVLNRTFTFRMEGRGRAREALVYLAVQGAGGAANIAVYTVAILAAPVLKHYLLVPLAMGSAAGLCLTYAGSKHLAFRKAPVMAAE